MADIKQTQVNGYAKLLQQMFLFRGFSADEIAALLCLPGITLVRYAAGEEILSAHTGSKGLGVLLRGSAVVEKHAKDGYIRMSELKPCALFGMAAMFLSEDAHAYPTRILAQKDSAALLIPEDTFRDMLKADFRLAENYIRYLTRRIHFLNDRIEELICPTTDQRVLLYLAQNAEDGRFTLAMTTLAQSLSISRASLYRALDKLEAGGRIRRNRRTIELVSARQGEPL